MRAFYGAMILTALLAAPAGADDEQNPPSEEPQGIQVFDRQPTSAADSILRVTCDPDSGLSNPSLIDNLLKSRELLHAAIANVSAEAAKSAQAPEDKFDIYGVTVPFAAEKSKGRPQVTLTIDPTLGFAGTDRAPPAPPAGVYMSRIGVFSFDARVPADKLLSALAEQLRHKLAWLDVDNTQLELMKVVVKETGQGMLRDRKDLERLREALGVVLGDDFRQQIYARQEADLTAMKVEVEGLRARRRALEAQIAALSNTIDKGAAQDAVVQQLQAVVALRETQRKRIEALSKGAVSVEQIENAEAALAEAKAELAKQLRAAAQGAGGDRLASLQRRLDETAIDLAESEEKLEHLPKAISRDTAELALRQLTIELKEQQYRDVLGDLNRLQSRKHTKQPTVTLIPLN
jgi:hypothetical protein